MPDTQNQGATEPVFLEGCSAAKSAIPNGVRCTGCFFSDGSSFVEGTCRIARNHKQFVISCQHTHHIAARNEVGCKRKEIAPPSRKEEVCICTESEPGISVFGMAVEVN